MPKTLSPIGQLCQKVAAQLEKDGWTQGGRPGGSPENEQCGHCMLNAVLCVDHLADLHAIALAMGFESVDQAYAWNDSPLRKKAEVLARLRSVS